MKRGINERLAKIKRDPLTYKNWMHVCRKVAKKYKMKPFPKEYTDRIWRMAAKGKKTAKKYYLSYW